MMQRLWAACTIALLASACALGHPARSATLGEAGAAGQTWRSGDDELSATMRAIGNQLRSAGIEASRESFRGFLTTGARTTSKFNVPANTCATLIAIASRAVHDMDAALYSPEGDLLAVDSQPDAHPTMQVCTGAEPRALYYALQVYEGAGTFVVAMFLGEQATLERAAKLLGARPTLARLGNAETDGPGRVAAFREGLQRRGFEPLHAPMRMQLARDQDIRVALRVKPGQCYTAAGFALEGLRDVDLRVLDDEGGEVARDESREEDASAQFCASRRAEYAAELRGVDGAGTALLMVFEAEAASIGGLSGLWLGERPLARAATVPLDEALAAAARRSTDDGFKPGRALLTGRLGPGEVIAQPFALAAQRCARIHAVGGPGVRKLSLIAKDTAGQTLASAEGRADTTYVHVCSATARELELQLHAAAGAGAFTLAAYEAPLASVSPAGADERVGAALQQAVSQARDAGYKPLETFEAGPKRLALGRVEPLSLELAPGEARCVRAYVLSSARSARAQLWVDGTPVDEPVVEGQAARFCTGGEAQGSVPVQLRLWSNAPDRGDAWLMVLTR
jgi:hypothetical protein